MNISEQEIQILVDCIGAVETGGQVYGERDYANYTSAYENSSDEHSITIGAYQEFSENARDLLKEIKNLYPDIFAKFDDADLSSDIKLSSWYGYNPDKKSKKAKAIVNIISSDEGKLVQDLRIVKLLNQYINYAKSIGVEDTDALFMCANFIHQGGNGACKRLVEKIDKPYTIDKLYQATLSDTGNQVGAYRDRQRLMYHWIKQYLNGGMNMSENEIRKKVATWLVKYLGISEGSKQHKEILGFLNNNGFKRYKMTESDAWCATAVSAAFIALGLTDVFPCIECSCYYMVEGAKKVGIWVEDDAYTPKIGDVVLYAWKDNGVGDCGLVPDHVGIVYAVNGKDITVIEGNYHDSVSYRQIQVNGRYIRGYITPKYHTIATVVNSKSESTVVGSTENSVVNIEDIKVGDTVKFIGTKHYSNSFATKASSCKSGEAIVTAISKNAQHKYHLIAVSGKGSTVYGWVDEVDIESISETKTTKTASSSAITMSNINSNTLNVDTATNCSKDLAGEYETTSDLNLRAGAGTNKKLILTMKKGLKVVNYGYYSLSSGVKWLYIAYIDPRSGEKYLGFCSSNFLKKK